MKLGPDKFFCFVTPKNCVCGNIRWEVKSNYAREIRFQLSGHTRRIHLFSVLRPLQIETLPGRGCKMLRRQIFTLNLWPSNGSCTRTCNIRKMSRMHNTVSAPGEFFPLASIVKRQITTCIWTSLFTLVVKLLDEVCYCQTKRVGDKYKFLFSQFV